ncbi:MAG: ankyrin repeat domain-containing protein [Alphaproteobacteria bacterium]|nr:ankyrin repeat domain-containing protein [Alphaproteobacteria bacterium]
MRNFLLGCSAVAMLLNETCVLAKDNNFEETNSRYKINAQQKLALEKQFFVAIQKNDIDAVKKLLTLQDEKSGRKFLIVPKIKESALILAIQLGYGNIVQALLDVKTRANAENNDGQQALMLAVNSGHAKIVQMLIEKGAKIDGQNNSDKPKLSVKSAVLLTAVYKGYKDIVNILLDAEADVNAKDADGTTALMFAVKKNYSEIADLLIKSKADVNAKDNFGNTALTYATDIDSYPLAKTLIEKGADVNADGGAALKIVAQVEDEDRFKIMQLMINKKVNINSTDDRGVTPLMLAAQYNEMALPLLIEAGANIHAKDKEGYSVLDYAYMGNREKNVQLLKTKGVQSNKIKAK